MESIGFPSRASRRTMGLLQFQLPETLPIGGQAALEQLRFVAGYDRTPFPTTMRRQGHSLEITHDLSESGYICAPWPIPDAGFPVTVTATLRERPESYRLLTELARGKLNQIRNAAEEWKLGGLELPKQITDAFHAVTAKFVHAVVDPAATDTDESSAAALEQAYKIGVDLTDFFIGAASKLQQARIGKPAARCTCQIPGRLSADDADMYLEAFEVVHFAPRWSEIESGPSIYDWSAADAVIDWAAGQGRPVIFGPLVDLGSDALPAWLNISDGDVATLSAYFCDFIETAVLRYKDRVRDWVLCTGFNHADLYALNQDERLRLVVRMLEAARGADPEGRWVIGVSQPWGEYLDHADHTLSPLVFCDTLLRTGLSIAGFNLELIAGESPRGSLLRDGLELLRLFELYGLLGVPLDITASHPGRVMTGQTPQPFSAFSTCYKASESADAQAEWGGWLATLAGTMSHVRCFSWNQWADDAGARGLIAADGQAKPLLFRLRRLLAEFGA
jgi:hypothetical protein